MQLYVFVVGMILGFSQLSAQAILKIDGIDHVYLEDMSFLKQVNEEKFGVNTIGLDESKRASQLCWEGFYYSTKRSHIYAPSMNDENPLFINADDLLDIRKREFGKLFLPLKAENRLVLEKQDGNYKYTLSVLNEHLLAVGRYRKSNYRLDGTLVEEEWILEKAHKYPYYLIEVNGKTMIGLLELKVSGFWNGGYIAETKDQMFVKVGNFDFSDAQPVQQSKSEQIQFLAYDSEDFERDFYFLDKQADGKYQLKDYLGSTLLDNTYDTIRFVNHFILTENNGQKEVHFQDFKTTPLKNIRVAYPYYSNRRPYLLEVLQDNQVKVVDISGKILSTEEIPNSETFFLCGTVPSWRYEIREHTVTYYDMGYGSWPAEDSLKISLAELRADEIHFVNGTKSVFFDTNMESGIISGSTLKFKKKGKYGLVTVDFDTSASSVATNRQAQVSYIIDLPAIFDEIIFAHNQPLKIKQGNLYGWYPFNNKAKYKILENFGHNFSRFELPNGKKGWMDKQGNEYLDE